ncbi:MAG: TM0106 family RecB-like putative nuclease [Leptolyngbyaceae cyanobacterium SM1_3_5]|nr:TM0106 family RecB-like putative nuclease [Leptolyngbyaceae cyanobacterium SM1_3_5]
MWLTDELFFNFQRCRRRAFLDRFGDETQRDPPSDYVLKLRQDSLAHRRTVLSDAIVQSQPVYPRGDWNAGAAATLDLMRQGVDRITKGVLLLAIDGGITLVSCPDVLVRQPGDSVLGDWHYAPIDIRLGKRPKLDYQFTVAFHTFVLAGVQRTWSKAWLILRQRGKYQVNLAEMLPRMEDALQACIELLQTQTEPEVFIANNRCDLCPWFGHCYDIAQQQNHLSLLPGVTPSRYVQLRAIELLSVEALAIARPKQLESLPGFGIHVADRLIRQAQSQLQNRALPIYTSPSHTLLTEIELPTAPIELYYDIESAPDHNLAYLHGVLVVDRIAQTETFHALWADDAEAEAIVWQQFLALTAQYADAPIFHFCPYEVQTVQQLAAAFGTPNRQIKPLLDRFVDLHERITRVATLPVESYALKPIARWLNFDWRDADASGAQSIYWYAQWRSTGDPVFLNAILRYNEDDCRATHHVKDWLVQFARPELSQIS